MLTNKSGALRLDPCLFDDRRLLAALLALLAYRPTVPPGRIARAFRIFRLNRQAYLV
jgi:hypothetical protein